MKKTVNAEDYDVVIENSSLSSFGEYVKNVLGTSSVKLMIVSDDKVHALYSGDTRKSLTEAGFTLANDFVFPHGEESKNLTVLGEILSHAVNEGLTRSDCIVALGGGVTGDMAGFAAAVYLRGIRYVSIPTSILAMVDSSVGGKTAVDIPEGKNLVGAFHKPSFVLTDTSLLKTLPNDFVSDGMAEVIKYGVLGNTALFKLLENTVSLDDDIDEIVYECVKDKRDVVVRDFKDHGERQKLNLGHTFGHGIELLSGYTVSHGHAVASGMYFIMECAVRNGLCHKENLDRLEKLLRKFSLDPFIYKNYDINKLIEASSHDKKKSGDSITLVVPICIGKCELMKIPFKDIEKFVLGELTWK